MEHLRITVEGKAYDVVVEKIDDDDSESYSPPATAVLPKPAANPAASVPPAPNGSVVSPLAGVVHSIELGVGAIVAAGDLVITLKAMKMATSINAPSNGTITAIHVKVGDAVEEGQSLYTLT